jgi:hypothetical protein
MQLAPNSAQKYSILQEQADAADRLSRAQAAATQQQVQLAPEEAAARNYATRGQGYSAIQQGSLFGVNAGLAPMLAQSEASQRNASALDETTHAFNNQYQVQYNPDITQAATDRMYGPNASGGSLSANPGGGGYSRPGMFDLSGTPNTNVIGGNPVGYDAGTSQVPGVGDGKTDTQPAMLAPGEAVLNRGAAEHLGRDTISLLNAIGAHKMGLTIDPRPGSTQNTQDDRSETPGYAWGTPSVGAPPAPGQTVTGGAWNPNGTNNPQSPTAAISGSGIVRTPRVVGQTSKPQAMNDTPSYAKGTSKVPGKGAGKPADKGGKGKASPPDSSPMSDAAAAHTPDGSGLPPGIIQALMQMGGPQAGGPPGAPGGTPPQMGGGIPMGGGPAPLSMPPLARRA